MVFFLLHKKPVENCPECSRSSDVGSREKPSNNNSVANGSGDTQNNNSENKNIDEVNKLMTNAGTGIKPVPVLNQKTELIELNFDSIAAKVLFDALDIKTAKCKYCGDEITSKNWGGLLPPKIMICNNLLCLTEYINDHPEIKFKEERK